MLRLLNPSRHHLSKGQPQEHLTETETINHPLIGGLQGVVNHNSGQTDQLLLIQERWPWGVVTAEYKAGPGPREHYWSKCQGCYRKMC